MEWNTSSSGVQVKEQQQQQQNEGGEMTMMVEGLYVKVMTDEQMELLRKQIAVYAVICEQLVEMHKSFSAQYDIAGIRLGNPYFDPFMACGGQKITARQRWTPTPVQLQILERVYEECNGNPGKQKILEMTTELAHHGPISETNVYNWFQNRRARIKRKQSGVPLHATESEAEKHVLSKKGTPENIQSFERTDNFYLQSPDMGMFNPFWQIDRYTSLDDA